MSLLGFSDASEEAYAGVVYLRMVDGQNAVYVALVLSNTKVAPIKRLTIPRLELCGANLLATLLNRVQKAINIASKNAYAWTDSTIVLSWLTGNPRCFKTFVGNRVSNIMELVAPSQWHRSDNPADIASRGSFRSELVQQNLWWNGPHWLHSPESEWPATPEVPSYPVPSVFPCDPTVSAEVLVPMLPRAWLPTPFVGALPFHVSGT